MIKSTDKLYRIDWVEGCKVWHAVSLRYKHIQSRHPVAGKCLRILFDRVELFATLKWMVNNSNKDSELSTYNIEDLSVDLGLELFHMRLTECNLDKQPRAELIALFKEVDKKVDGREVNEFGWYAPWFVLSRHLDPDCKMVYEKKDMTCWELLK